MLKKLPTKAGRNGVSTPAPSPKSRGDDAHFAAPPASAPQTRAGRKLVVYVAAAAILWSYWPTLAAMHEKWWADPQYSHAYLVPVFALVLLWLRRGQLAQVNPGPSWWGAMLLLAGVGLRLAGAYLYFDWFEAVSLLPMLAGSALLLGGWAALRWSWLPIAFLGFMIPLPHRIETGLSHPLQRLATLASAFTLQTLGLPAIAEGNRIIVNQAQIDVVEACSGLGMLLLFFAMATAVAILSRRTLWEKAFIFASAAPIGVVANVIRIAATALVYETAGREWADFVHDQAGWLMMPVALTLLWLEMGCLSRLFIEVAAVSPLPLDPAGVSPADKQSRIRLRHVRTS